MICGWTDRWGNPGRCWGGRATRLMQQGQMVQMNPHPSTQDGALGGTSGCVQQDGASHMKNGGVTVCIISIKFTFRISWTSKTKAWSGSVSFCCCCQMPPASEWTHHSIPTCFSSNQLPFLSASCLLSRNNHRFGVLHQTFDQTHDYNKPMQKILSTFRQAKHNVQNLRTIFCRYYEPVEFAKIFPFDGLWALF